MANEAAAAPVVLVQPAGGLAAIGSSAIRLAPMQSALVGWSWADSNRWVQQIAQSAARLESAVSEVWRARRRAAGRCCAWRSLADRSVEQLPAVLSAPRRPSAQ